MISYLPHLIKVNSEIESFGKSKKFGQA